ncbi:mechanosensitive ion channel family protein [Reinekea marinisedimentorum]|uniref:Small-conductance mechanosensitive channel n=1 Tax=Reinekea marinisedimentorum TaxID=230495 RepID=A0A4R3HVE0_9GAMM|nr:mechanosensitive ion channel family protein [Reinekea marinisedimentorum]TCS37196.1 small conductance mechanosensitive channel [Reinekea marinisedimentorum]
MEIELEQAQKIYDMLTEFVVTYSFQILGAFIIIIIGYWLASKVGNLVERLMLGKKIDVTLSRFTGSIAKIVLLVMVLVISLSNLGISVTPFVAAIGALGIGAGLAVQGMLSNYAAGFTIIITRPFIVGDTISLLGVTGIVDSVHLGYVFLIDEDNVRIQIPNRHIVGEIIHNSAKNLLIELKIGVTYDSDPEQVTRVIKSAVQSVEGLAADASVQVGIDNFGDFSINFGVRFWAPTDRHFELKYAANRAVWDALREANIQIPFPQREVRMLG